MNKVNPFILVLLVIVVLSLSCSSENSFNKKISGKWEMIKVLEVSEDVTQNHNPGNNRWISFKADPDFPAGGTFESGGSPIRLKYFAGRLLKDNLRG